MSFNFAEFGLPVDVPVRMPILDIKTRTPMLRPDGSEAYVELLSRDSQAWRDAQRQREQRRADMKRPLTDEEEFAEWNAHLASVTTGWSLVTFDGRPFDAPFSRQAAKELYATPGWFWLREEVLGFTVQRGNFVPPRSSD